MTAWEQPSEIVPRVARATSATLSRRVVLGHAAAVGLGAGARDGLVVSSGRVGAARPGLGPTAFSALGRDLATPTDGARFPANFVWGAATSAYQIEGAVAETGRAPSI